MISLNLRSSFFKIICIVLYNIKESKLVHTMYSMEDVSTKM